MRSHTINAMSRSKIRHIATSYDGRVFAVGEWVRHLQTWNIETKTLLAEFDSVLEPGGHRLAVARDGRLCVAGAYDGGSLASNRYLGGSIAAYSTSTGEMIWQNKKIKRVQRIEFGTHQKDILFASFDDQPLHVIDARDGSILEKIRGVRRIDESPFGLIQFRQSGTGYTLVDTNEGRVVGCLSDRNYGPLDVTFTDVYVVVSEGGGRIRCFDQSDCSQVWEHWSEDGHHVVAMKYNETTREIAGIDWDYKKGASDSILLLEESTGRTRMKIPADISLENAAFALKGTILITSDGCLIGTDDGKEKTRLSFPRENGLHSPKVKQ